MEKARCDAAKFELFYRVKEAYYEYYYLGKAISITSEHFDLMRDLERVTSAINSADKASKSELIKAQVELAKLEDRLLSLRDLERPLRSRLNAVLGRSQDGVLPWPTPIEYREVEFDEEQLIAWLKQANPELVALQSLARVDTVRKVLAGRA